MAQSAQGALRPGDHAPDFRLEDQHGTWVQLSSYRGEKSVALAFYIKAFTSG